MGHVGLALATSASAWLNAGLLLRGLSRDGIYQFQPGWGMYALRLLSATTAMALAAGLLCADVEVWLGWGWQLRTLNIFGVVAAGLLAYLLTHWLMGTRMRHLRAPRGA